MTLLKIDLRKSISPNYFKQKKILFMSMIASSCSSNPYAGEPIVLVHGGAGEILDGGLLAKLEGVKNAAREGYKALQACDGNSLDAVEVAVQQMEVDPQFNAGYGSVLTWDGEVEADASIMNGADLNIGCVSIVKNILHPITLARNVMEKSRHSYLAGEGVMQYASDAGFEILPDGCLVTQEAKEALERYKNSTFITLDFGSMGTVGAVAIDAEGNLSAATSTGGLIGKLPGRIGDSSIIGAGTYADNVIGAVSATGHGETIMKYNLASRILNLIDSKGVSAQEAAQTVLDGMTERFNQTAGVISISAEGGVGIYFTSRRMVWAYQQADVLYFGSDRDVTHFEVIGEPKV